MSHRHRMLAVLVVAATMSGAVTSATAAPGDPGEPRKLSPDITISGGNVFSSGYEFSPDGSTILYRGDLENNGSSSPIWSVDIESGDHARVSAGRVRYDFVVTADSSRVVFHEWTRDRITSARLDGTDRVKLGDVDSGAPTLAVSPDGSRVVHDQVIDSERVRVSQPPAGGEAVTLVEGWERAWFTPDSGHVLALRDTNRGRPGNRELVVVPVDGGPTILLSPLVPAGGHVLDVAATPDATGAVYRAEQDVNKVVELYATPLDASTNTKLNGSLVERGDVHRFLVSPDGTRVVYGADQAVNNRRELYSVPVGGGTPVRLNADLPEGGDTFPACPGCGSNSYLKRYRLPSISPDSSTVVYISDQEVDKRRELYAVPIEGGTPVKLNATLPAGGDVKAYAISPDSSTVVYVADQAVNDREELWAVPIGGGTPLRLNAALPGGGDIHLSEHPTVPEITPDGTSVVYIADQDVNNVRELYVVPISGGASVKLNGPMVTGGDLKSWRISPDGSQVGYVADQDTNNVRELYLVSLPD